MTSVCLVGDTLGYPAGGGHRWVYLNWALGLRAAGCQVRWLEAVPDQTGDEQLAGWEAALRSDLAPHGLQDSVILYDQRSGQSPDAALEDLNGQIDLLLVLSYRVAAPLLELAPRSAMIDLDPGLTQLWIRGGQLVVPRHDAYFSIGEAARRPGGLPACGIVWQYTPPCVDLEAWTVAEADPGAPYTTVSHWWTAPDEGWIELDGQWIENSKRAGFEPFLGVAARAPVGLELALGGLDSPVERQRLTALGWQVRDAWQVASTTEGYASYVRSSRGAFSCAKPSVSRLAVGWISDRTLCYLASGKPAVVQHSGELELPDPDHGLLRYRTPEQALDALQRVEANYARHCNAARALAEARFDARRVATALLEKVLA